MTPLNPEHALRYFEQQARFWKREGAMRLTHHYEYAARCLRADLHGPAFYADDVDALRRHPDIPWNIGGKSGAEAVAEWRLDLADRIERSLAARPAADAREM